MTLFTYSACPRGSAANVSPHGQKDNAVLFLGILDGQPRASRSTPPFSLWNPPKNPAFLTYKVPGKCSDGPCGSVLLPPIHAAWVTTHEHHVLEFVEGLVCGASDLMVDVGTNDGVFTLLAAHHGCQVVGFELQSACLDILLGQVALNGVDTRVITFQRAVSNSSGIKLHIPDTGCHGGRSAFQSGAKEIETVTLDEVFLSAGRHITFLKVDTEGSESLVIQGAAQLFSQHLVISCIMETHLWVSELA